MFQNSITNSLVCPVRGVYEHSSQLACHPVPSSLSSIKGSWLCVEHLRNIVIAPLLFKRLLYLLCNYKAIARHSSYLDKLI